MSKGNEDVILISRNKKKRTAEVVFKGEGWSVTRHLKYDSDRGEYVSKCKLYSVKSLG